MSGLVNGLRTCADIARLVAKTPEQEDAVEKTYSFINGSSWLDDFSVSQDQADPETGLIALSRSDLSYLRDTLVLAGQAAKTLAASDILQAILTGAAGSPINTNAWKDPRGVAERSVKMITSALRLHSKKIIERSSDYEYTGP